MFAGVGGAGGRVLVGGGGGLMGGPFTTGCAPFTPVPPPGNPDGPLPNVDMPLHALPVLGVPGLPPAPPVPEVPHGSAGIGGGGRLTRSGTGGATTDGPRMRIVAAPLTMLPRSVGAGGPFGTGDARSLPADNRRLLFTSGTTGPRLFSRIRTVSAQPNAGTPHNPTRIQHNMAYTGAFTGY